MLPRRPFGPLWVLPLLLLAILLPGGVDLHGQAGTTADIDLDNADRILAQARGHDNSEVRLSLYRSVEEEARAALEADPDDHEARWMLLATLGLLVDEVGAREKVQAAREVHEHAQVLLEHDARHAGAHHAMGRLNAGILRLNRVVRFVALRLVGEDTLSEASWDDAEEHLRIAMEEEPDVLVHRLELARAFETQGRHDEMLELLEGIVVADATVPMDPVVQERARHILEDYS
ncbi:MAG: hypothetical protein EA352_03560 [Gemmatimonadales bacterium]|nr:MAG: hypothetical protein EA352_03560 [Gemmatimonadales bacterium]